jgi:DNA-binding transcriptional LysR family regulator
MHIRFLKIFCDIVHLASFSRAAEANGISQSNASQVVHQLEERMGVRLIDRSKRPFVLTPEGQRFHEGSQVIVQRFDDLEREVRSLNAATAARLTVASIYSVGLAHMSRFLREFLAANPRADVRLEYLHPHRVYETVETGQADLGLVSYPEASATLAAINWRSEPMVLVCHPQHPLAGRESVPLEAIQDQPLVGFQEGLKIRSEIDRVLAERHIPVKIELEFDNIETIKQAIEVGAGVSLLPQPTIGRELAMGSLAMVALEGQPLARPLGIIHRRDRKLSETAERFVALLQSQAMEAMDIIVAPATNGRVHAGQAVSGGQGAEMSAVGNAR